MKKTLVILGLVASLLLIFLGGYRFGKNHAIYDAKVYKNSDGTVTIILDGEANIYNQD